ncbi:MAG: serine hydrolase [Marinobacter sp.]|uniref:serine hydrolase n=1 Tax=Marinobacter sp. TaxID=50741 RepID=UPI003569B512
MDQTDGVDSFRSMRSTPFALVGVVLLMSLFAMSAAAEDWQADLRHSLQSIDDEYPGELGVFVHDLESNRTVSLRADESWYLASTIKVPVAMAVMEAVDRKELTLDTEVELESTDFVDGAGETNWKSPGDKVTVRYLFEQMLIHSDNTATDVLIRVVGKDAVNDLIAAITEGGIGEITSLADVRRYAYSRFHERAMDLSSDDMFTIKKAGAGSNRVQALAKVLDVEPGDFQVPDLDAAFDRYYDSGLNSGRLDDFSRVFEALATNQVLNETSHRHILSLLEKIETGDNRIQAGLPEHVSFAHKTGTQHRRACNIGLAMAGDHPGVIIAACGRNTADLGASEKAFRQVGEAVTDTGVFGDD